MGKAINKNKRQLIFEKYNGKCAYCGINLDYNNFNADHIIPIQRGVKGKERLNSTLNLGTNSLENYNPSCVSCNSSKWSNDIETWRNILANKYDNLIKKEAGLKILINLGIIKYSKKDVVFYFEKI